MGPFPIWDMTDFRDKRTRGRRGTALVGPATESNQFTHTAAIWWRIGTNIVGSTKGCTSTCVNPADRSVEPVSRHKSQPSNTHFHGRLIICCNPQLPEPAGAATCSTQANRPPAAAHGAPRPGLAPAYRPSTESANRTRNPPMPREDRGSLQQFPEDPSRSRNVWPGDAAHHAFAGWVRWR